MESKNNKMKKNKKIKLFTIFEMTHKMYGISQDVTDYFENIENQRKSKAKEAALKAYKKTREKADHK